MSIQRGVIAAFALLAAFCAAAAGGERVETNLGDDQFIAGGNVSRTQPVAGDLIAAGGEVDLEAAVQGDAVAAGGNLRIGGSVGQNLYGAGGRVHIDAQVARNVRVAGGRVEVGPSASVKGNVTVAGGQVSVRGTVKGYVQAAGGHVFIDGPIDGDVVANAGQVELGPNAKVGGSFRYRSRDDLVRDPAAKVAGTVERLSSMAAGSGVAASGRTHLGMAGGWIWSAGLIVLAALLAAAVPPASMRVSGELRAHPGLSLLFGFVALVCVPVAIIVLLVTVIGIPVALIVLLAYLVLLVVGYVSAAVGAGEAALGNLRPADAARSSWRVLAAVVAMLVLTIVARIPYLGGIVAFVAMLMGIGAILMALRPGKATDAGLAAAPLS
jgi:cytoskeletal protein CcmA (bactofilin family)